MRKSTKNRNVKRSSRKRVWTREGIEWKDWKGEDSDFDKGKETYVRRTFTSRYSSSIFLERKQILEQDYFSGEDGRVRIEGDFDEMFEQDSGMIWRFSRVG